MPVPLDAREALTLYNDRDVLIGCAVKLASLHLNSTGKSWVCPVPSCARAPSGPCAEHLASHFLADHFAQVKCFAAVLAKVQQQCEQAGHCVLSQEHDESGEDWQDHLAQHHLEDVWALAQKLDRSFSYQGMPARTFAGPAAKLQPATQSIANNPLAFMPRTPRATESKVQVMSATQSNLGHDILYPCALGCPCRPLHGWQVQSHILNEHLPLLIQWLHKHKRHAVSNRLLTSATSAAQPWPVELAHADNAQHTSIHLTSDHLPYSPRSPTRAASPLPLGNPRAAVVPPPVNVMSSPPISPDKSRLYKAGFRTGYADVEPQAALASPQIPASRQVAARQLLGQDSYTHFQSGDERQLEWQQQSLSSPASPSKQSSTTWLTSRLSHLACEIADLRCRLTAVIRQGPAGGMTGLVEVLQELEPQLDAIGLELHGLAVSPAAMRGPPSLYTTSTSPSPPPSWSTAILAAASLTSQLASQQAALLRRTRPADSTFLTATARSAGYAGDLSGSRASHGHSSWKTGTWGRDSHVSAASTAHGVRAFVLTGSSTCDDHVSEQLSKGAVRLQHQLGHVLEWVLSVIRAACPGAVPSPVQPAKDSGQPASGRGHAARDKAAKVAVHLNTARLQGVNAAWQVVPDQEEGVRKVHADVCVVGSWSLAGCQYQGMSTTWLAQVAEQLHQAAVDVCVLQQVPCQTAVSALQVLMQELDCQGQWSVCMVEQTAAAAAALPPHLTSGQGTRATHALLWRSKPPPAGISLWGGTCQASLHSLDTTHGLFSSAPWFGLLTAHHRPLLVINVDLSEDMDQAALEVRRLPLLASAAQAGNPGLYQDPATSPGVVLLVSMSAAASAKLASGLLSHRARMDNAWKHVAASGWQQVVSSGAGAQEARHTSWVVIRKGTLPPGCVAMAHPLPASLTNQTHTTLRAVNAAQQPHQIQTCLLTVDWWLPESATQRPTLASTDEQFRPPDVLLACVSATQQSVSPGNTQYTDDPAVAALACAHQATLTAANKPPPATTTSNINKQDQPRNTQAAPQTRQLSPKRQQPASDGRSLPPLLEVTEDGLGLSWEEQVLGVTARATPRHVSPLTHSSVGASLLPSPTLTAHSPSRAVQDIPTTDKPAPLTSSAGQLTGQQAEAAGLVGQPAVAAPAAVALVDALDSAYTTPDFLALAQALISNTGWPEAGEAQKPSRHPSSALAPSKDLPPTVQEQQAPSTQTAAGPTAAVPALTHGSPAQLAGSASVMRPAVSAQADQQPTVIVSQLQLVSTYAQAVKSGVPQPLSGAAKERFRQPSGSSSQPADAMVVQESSSVPQTPADASLQQYSTRGAGGAAALTTEVVESRLVGGLDVVLSDSDGCSSNEPSEAGGDMTARVTAQGNITGTLMYDDDEEEDEVEEVAGSSRKEEGSSSTACTGGQPAPEQQHVIARQQSPQGNSSLAGGAGDAPSRHAYGQALQLHAAPVHAGQIQAASSQQPSVEHQVSNSVHAGQCEPGDSSPAGVSGQGSAALQESSQDALLSEADDDMILELLGERLSKPAASTAPSLGPVPAPAPHSVRVSPAAGSTPQQATQPACNADDSLFEDALSELVPSSKSNSQKVPGAGGKAAAQTVVSKVSKVDNLKRQPSDELVLFGASDDDWSAFVPSKPGAAPTLMPAQTQQVVVGQAGSHKPAQQVPHVIDDLLDAEWSNALLDPDAFISSLKQGRPREGHLATLAPTTQTSTRPAAASPAPVWAKPASQQPFSWATQADAAGSVDEDDDELLQLAPSSSLPPQLSTGKHATGLATSGSVKPSPGGRSILGGGSMHSTKTAELEMVDAFMQELDLM